VKRLAATLALVSVLLAPAHADDAVTQPADCPAPPQMSAPEALQKAMRDATDHGFLWKLTRDGHSSYLYGTLHIGQLSISLPGPALRAALAATDTLALEIDLTDPATQQEMARELAAWPSHPLPEALKARLKRHAAQACGIAPAQLESLPPTMQVITLGLLDARRAGYEPAYAQELVLSGFAHTAKRRIVSLETAQIQVHALMPPDGDSEAATVESGLDALEHDRSREQARQIIDTWAGSAIDRLEHYPEWCECTETSEDKAAMRRMLDDRNPQIARHIAALHAQGLKVLAAVGSLHMIGTTSLPRLLAADGFTVERIVPAVR